MTRELFREDAYRRTCEAVIERVDRDRIFLDQTVFYPMGGGQPGDIGVLRLRGGEVIKVCDTRKGEAPGEICHVSQEILSPAMVNQPVVAQIDWDRRYRLMRVHTCLHLLSSVITAGVTGGSIRDGSGRLDFDLPDSTIDKELLTIQLNKLIREDRPVTCRWITDTELDAQPELVKTMSVQPPRGQGRVRLLQIEGVDLQPCGGTHVSRTREIGQVRVTKIEKKGKHNRRVNVELIDGVTK